MTLRIFSSLLVVFCLASCGLEGETRTNQEKVIDFASQLPRSGQGGGLYFFEKDGILGWEPTILVFGYIDNLDACNVILEAARRTSPNISFRCSVAN